MSERLLKPKEAADRVGMPRTTFLVKCEEMGLLPVILGESMKSAKRWPESEINAFIAKRIQARNQHAEQADRRQREILKLVRTKRRA